MPPLPEPSLPFEVVLHRPEIPPNTGNVARMCACTGSRLHLVTPLGFSIDDAQLKRAGLDYWPQVFARTYASFEEVLEAMPDRGVHLFTAAAPRTLWEVALRPGDLLVFGSESVGLPEAILGRWPERQVAIPMRPGRRSLNLSAAAAVAVYEGLRQNLGASPDP
jgi:tRNA (cytidine/uridine-2'-O-)-methyltransferase